MESLEREDCQSNEGRSGKSVRQAVPMFLRFLTIFNIDELVEMKRPPV